MYVKRKQKGDRIKGSEKKKTKGERISHALSSVGLPGAQL